ncbi:MAG: galactokinase [Alphaproteobacteria bacterium]|nr:galactokinase [Alphaproteobacteria bacterium]
MGKSWTPGRVNLIGEWIDFNGGWVLPAALPLGVEITVTPHREALDRVCSAQFDNRAEAPLNTPARGHWADYVFGALQAARREGYLAGGANVEVTSDIPAGAGVSSSAAVTLGVLKAVAPETTCRTHLAKLARGVENNFIGVPCGIMDQMAVAHTLPGEALSLNTRTLDFDRVAIPPDWRFVVLHSGVTRKLADGRYKLRREACLEAARAVELDWLCDADDISDLPASLRPIARHVIDENHRAKAAIKALRAGEAEKFGALMTASHVSLRDDFDVSTPEVDALVASAVDRGALGARITGAGFGGCCVLLLPGSMGQDWLDPLLNDHPAARLICELERV